jgi:hypothetical protein
MYTKRKCDQSSKVYKMERVTRLRGAKRCKGAKCCKLEKVVVDVGGTKGNASISRRHKVNEKRDRRSIREP